MQNRKTNKRKHDEMMAESSDNLIEPTLENTVTQSTIIDLFAEKISVKDRTQLSMTNSILHAFFHTNDLNYWKKRYRFEFGELIFDEMHREQYIAEYFLQKSRSLPGKQAVFLHKLQQHIRQFPNAIWVHYYQAVLESKNELENFFDDTKSLDHALKAVSFGDLRAGEFIIDYHAQQVFSHSIPINAEPLNTLIAVLKKLPISMHSKKIHCLAHCLLTRCPLSVSEKEFYKHQALAFFLSLIDPLDKNIRQFILFSTHAFELSGFISPFQAKLLQQNLLLLSAKNVVDVINYYAQNSKLPEILRNNLKNWLNNHFLLAESQNETNRAYSLKRS